MFGKKMASGAGQSPSFKKFCKFKDKYIFSYPSTDEEGKVVKCLSLYA